MEEAAGADEPWSAGGLAGPTALVEPADDGPEGPNGSENVGVGSAVRVPTEAGDMGMAEAEAEAVVEPKGSTAGFDVGVAAS